MSATVVGVGIPASFALTNNPGAPASIVTVSGGGQSATVFTAFLNPLVVLVADVFGNSLSGATVTFASPGTGAGVTFPRGATTTTDANGNASVAVSGNTEAGSYAVTGTVSGSGTPASFGLTNTAGSPANLVNILRQRAVSDREYATVHQSVGGASDRLVR